MRYFEDFRLGERFEAGPYVLSREELLDFARKYDPQPFHLDEEAARKTHFGGLVASGWQTAVIAHRLTMGVLEDAAAQGSPGVEELRWLKPVRPGDALSMRAEVVELRRSETKPRGTVKWTISLTNQHGETVMTFRGLVLIQRRDAHG